MISLDTNVLVRFLTRDDARQFRPVMELLNREELTFFVCDLVLAETDWVLRGLYGWTAAEVADAIARLTAVHNLTFSDEARLRASLQAVRQGADLADELIVSESSNQECDRLATFDRILIRRHAPFAVLPDADPPPRQHR